MDAAAMAQVSPLDGTLFGEDQLCFGCGPHNPSGFRLRFVEDGGAIVTRFVPERHHQGPAGVMHGGLITTVADETAGWAVIATTGKFGFTTSFQAQLRRPVRLGVEAECRATVVRQSSRVVRVSALVRQGGEDCYTAEFTFVILAQKAAEKLMGIEIPEAWRRFCR
jgi:uncharacterized protein (TIGR00369 family)